MSKLYKLKNYKFILVIYVLILNTLGVFLVGSASPGDQKKQIIGMVSGIVIMVILSLIDYSFILRFSWIIYLLAVGLLALVLVAGDSSKGAQRWFEIGGFRFQPSELAKILIILFFAYFFMKHEEKINTPKVLISSFILAGVPLALRRGHKAPADPVLDDIGLQPGQAGHLGEHQPPGQKEGVQQGLRLLRSVPVHRDGGSRQRLCHIIHSFSCFDMIILNNHMIVNWDLKIIY